MSMTEKDRKRFDEILQKWHIYQNEHSKMDIRERVENLEKLVFFILLNEMGEIGVSPELRQLVKDCGFDKLLEDALSP